MRTKNFAVSIEKLESCDLHTGTSLWRKYKEIRLVLLNEYKPLLSKHLPNGHPPSGKSFGEVLQTVRKVLYEKSEDVAIKKSKAAGGHPRRPFSPSWYPATERETVSVIARATVTLRVAAAVRVTVRVLVTKGRLNYTSNDS